MKLKYLLFSSLIFCFNIYSGLSDAQTVSTIAGGGLDGFAGDGMPATASSVELNAPDQIATDAAGNFYFADASNYRVRKISTSGIITTIAGNGVPGTGGDGGQATNAQLTDPIGVAVDASDNIYISDWGYDVIRKVNTSGIISTIAGNTIAGYTGDGGPATAAELNGPAHLAFDHTGNLYFADFYNNAIRKISTSGTISTVAGSGGVGGYFQDGGQATNAHLDQPNGVAFDAAGNMFIVDTHHDAIRKVNTSGIISTVAGDTTLGWGYTGDGGQATAAQFHWPNDVAIDNSGNIYVADYTNLVIRKINGTGIVSTIIGTGDWVFNGDGHTGTATNIGNPTAVLIVGSTLYFSDPQNARVRKMGVPTTGVATINVKDGETRLYPNPNNGRFTISGDINTRENSVKMTLENMTGEILMNDDIPVNKGSYSMEISAENTLPAGVYIIKVFSASCYTVMRFVKE